MNNYLMTYSTPIKALASGLCLRLIDEDIPTTYKPATSNNLHVIEADCEESTFDAILDEYLQVLLSDESLSDLFLPPAGVETDDRGEVSFFYNAPEEGTIEREIIGRWIKQASAKAA